MAAYDHHVIQQKISMQYYALCVVEGICKEDDVRQEIGRLMADFDHNDLRRMQTCDEPTHDGARY